MFSFIIGFLVAFGLVIVAVVTLWGRVKSAYVKFTEATADNVWTTQEKLDFADSVIVSIADAQTAWGFIQTLIKYLKNRKR